MISGEEDATSGRKVCFLETSYNIWCISMAFFRSPFSTCRMNNYKTKLTGLTRYVSSNGRARECREKDMNSKQAAMLSGKSLLEVLARMLVEHPCRHALFCPADASEHSGITGLGLCTALWTCSAVHKINTLYNFSITICTIYCRGKSRGQHLFDYGLQGKKILAFPFFSSYLNFPFPQKNTLWSANATCISQSF